MRNVVASRFSFGDATTVDGFYANVDKADPMQGLSVHSAVDGSVKDAADAPDRC